ncbi:hypothetical protein OROGR_032362 [Orobanche gracilis]
MAFTSPFIFSSTANRLSCHLHFLTSTSHRDWQTWRTFVRSINSSTTTLQSFRGFLQAQVRPASSATSDGHQPRTPSSSTLLLLSILKVKIASLLEMDVELEIPLELSREVERRQLRPIIENKPRIILVHTTSGYNWAGTAFQTENCWFFNIFVMGPNGTAHQSLIWDQICCAQRNLQYEVRADYFACACQQRIDGYNGTSFYNFTALYIIP